MRLEKRILFLLSGILSGGLIGLLVYYNIFDQFPAPAALFFIFLLCGIIGLLLQYLYYLTGQLVNTRIRWQDQFSLRFTLDLLINSIIGLSISGLLFVGYLALFEHVALANIWHMYWASFVTLWVLELTSIIIYSIVTVLFYAHYHFAEGQIADIMLERKQLKLQFEALKSQLSPHFLFNSLNTISSLIHQDKDSCEQFIRRLATTYHYILRTHKKQLVSIIEEIEFARSYYYLLQVRYQDGLKLDINIPDQLAELKIPPMTVQILVENAIKHNVFSTDNPLNIYIGVIDNTHLRVINNKTSRPSNVNSTRIGLNNIKKRIAFFTEKQVQINSETNFEVKIPLIHDNKAA